jgi:hypothetical protein
LAQSNRGETRSPNVGMATFIMMSSFSDFMHDACQARELAQMLIWE